MVPQRRIYFPLPATCYGTQRIVRSCKIICVYNCLTVFVTALVLSHIFNLTLWCDVSMLGDVNQRPRSVFRLPWLGVTIVFWDEIWNNKCLLCNPSNADWPTSHERFTTSRNKHRPLANETNRRNKEMTKKTRRTIK